MRTILLGNSLVRDMTRPRDWETISLPGIGLCGLSSWILDNLEQLRHSMIYIHVGPVVFSKRGDLGQSRQYVLDRRSLNVEQVFSVCLNAMASNNIYPVLCTVHPMDFEVYNASLCRGHLSSAKLAEYRRMGRDMIPIVIELNQQITEFNRRRDMATPFLHRQIMTRRRGVYSFRSRFISDGLHPRRSTAREWCEILRRVARINAAEVVRKQQRVRVRF